ncbi:MAG: tRNA epoxyqueuosine(34) reductase QueG [Alkalispirochaeta sp.]
MIARRAWFPEIDEELRELIQGEGLSLIGVCDADGEPTSIPARESEYQSWISFGHHGSMGFMERHAPLKFHPDALVPGCRSIVFVGLNYYQRPPEPPAAPAGRVARYAWGRDYHKELGNRIKRVARVLGERYPQERFRAWTDATPLAERFYGERAGIGFTGRNTLLINSEMGSWFVVGEILSTRRYTASEDAAGRHGACPTNCRRCIDVCPTGALYDAHRIDASRCISYLTIEHDGIIPEELRPLMGDWIFGCDLCQEVCPLNVRAQVTDVENFQKPIAGSHIDLGEIMTIRTDEEFTARFAGSPVMRAKRRGLIRNACIAAANTDAVELIPRLQSLAQDADEIIAIHAQWALDQLLPAQ